MIFLAWIRAVFIGWMTLLAIAFIVERPLLRWAAPLIGVSWMATARLSFDCLAMAATGFAAARFNRPHPMWTAGLLTATLSVSNFGDALTLSVPWLLRLVWNSLHDARYFDSLATSAETHVLLFGCLFGGAALSRPPEKPLSIGK